MARLLIVHHTVSPATQELLGAVLDGARTDDIEGVEVRTEAALSATASDLFGADALILGTPANIGYMSGALKVFFDTVFYPAQGTTGGLPYSLYVHGDSDTSGAVRAVESIAKGIGWERHRPPVTVTGRPDAGAREACWELGAVTALAALERA
ncbi:MULTISPECIES: flavodoxin family protein [Nocardiopsis]|uniref:Flavodoxin n=1 Tax=Nocardiopsis sinuspersici TaxID=501010 RepID=A0A1V3C7M3_9ACTN|nr:MULTISPECIES: flavodoxin family protein [Nocardiopsis]NYH53434.1 multimeric flavodoxin WrbA [Nocardiopsis sinuspersici]OOC56764.1 flavodoxin [Nocardiopsis sinuspersici]